MKRTTEGALWLLGIVAGTCVLGIVLRWGVPDEAQARRDFLVEHPAFTIERVAPYEEQIIALSFRISYRIPGDTTLREESMHYSKSNGEWKITWGDKR